MITAACLPEGAAEQGRGHLDGGGRIPVLVVRAYCHRTRLKLAVSAVPDLIIHLRDVESGVNDIVGFLRLRLRGGGCFVPRYFVQQRLDYNTNCIIKWAC
jgi:hypothetical protein